MLSTETEQRSTCSYSYYHRPPPSR